LPGVEPGVVLAGVSPPTDVVPGAGVAAGALPTAVPVAVPVAVPGDVCPGAESVFPAVAVACPALGAACPAPGVVCPAAGVELPDGAVVVVGVDCAQIPVARASDSPAITAALEPIKCVLMT